MTNTIEAALYLSTAQYLVLEDRSTYLACNRTCTLGIPCGGFATNKIMGPFTTIIGHARVCKKARLRGWRGGGGGW